MSDAPAHRYLPNTIEPKWQARWERENVFAAHNDSDKPKYYALCMFPYPSGTGLHVGHPESYTAIDIVSRYKRMQGFNVLNPFGFDAFGLPAERAAQREGRHPEGITRERMEYFRTQVKSLGFSFDWNREVVTCDVDYYHWTQWLFTLFFERGLAYLAEVPVWWCEAQGTVLANEEVVDNRYVETGDPVERRYMRQWMLRITDYAESLLEGLDDPSLDWPEGLKDMQRAWIGKSTGAQLSFVIDGHDDLTFDVFTTRPDTLGAATYCVLAPEHELVAAITTDDQREVVTTYVDAAAAKSERDRQVGEKDKTGVFTGAYAINPLNGRKVPVWVADYVLAGYGTGAIMAVPGHDERDHDFATVHGLPIESAYTLPEGFDIGAGVFLATETQTTVNSGQFDGLGQEEAKQAITDYLVAEGIGEAQTNYRLRDWLFSRQRYWGEPFPILHGPNGEIVTVPDDALPVELPHVDEYRPTDAGEPPLARATEWVNVTIDGKTWKRETNTMPQWAGSCWYWLRYMDPHNDKAAWSNEATEYWQAVDLYIGGVEHAVLHLLYARFWNHVFHDLGLVSVREPFTRLFNQGMILANAYRERNGKYHHPNDVVNLQDEPFEMVSPWTQQPVVTTWYATDEHGKRVPVEEKSGKMGKSLNNAVDPMDIVASHGADALRIYEMFMGPLDQVKVWSTSGCDGVLRFLQRVWRLFINDETGEVRPFASQTKPAARKALHVAVKEAGAGIEELRFNTPIAKMMEFVNVCGPDTPSRDDAEIFVRILSPWAPHVAEELWERFGHTESLTFEPWPAVDESALIDDEITIVIQIKGKKKTVIQVPVDADDDTILQAARDAADLSPDNVIKEILVPGRLVNFVTK
ncbi:leucine--tRNA ligase [Stomatohabitans albus]|uniref:leucine--tRNA ligase n=1 Tax=Stomatohabitans albus TaxID=3110766 RepID=UPI00300D2547